jgi:hypothetical protein
MSITDEGLDVEAGLEFQILSHLKVLSEAEKRREEQAKAEKDGVQMFRSFAGAAAVTTIVNASGVPITGALLTHDPCPQGYYLDLRHLTVFLLDPTSTSGSAYVVYLFKGSNPQDLSGGRLVALTTGVPTEAIYKKEQTIRAPEMFYLLVANLTAGVTIQSFLEGRLYPDSMANRVLD